MTDHTKYTKEQVRWLLMGAGWTFYQIRYECEDVPENNTAVVLALLKDLLDPCLNDEALLAFRQRCLTENIGVVVCDTWLELNE